MPILPATAMIPSEQLLQDAATDGALDPKEWPRVLETVLSRLEHIIHHEFPRPSIPAPEPLPPLVLSTPATTTEILSSQDVAHSNKENAPPSTPPSRPPVPTFSAGTPPSPSPSFPPELLALHSYIRNSLAKNFPKYPPHTVQRLAELIVSPRAHYRFLPSYLRALERVVSVSSPTTVFPLPQAVLPSNAGLVNGSTFNNTNNSLGSDESLGGALLTPIPWLRGDRSQDQDDSQANELISESTEMVDGPHGAGRIETVTVSNGIRMTQAAPRVLASNAPNPDALRDSGAVTQGELLRQEQEAGVVPNNQGQNRVLRSSPTEEMESSEDGALSSEEEEIPHARGPSEIGAEDTGPQQKRTSTGGLDIAGAVGRPAALSPGATSPPREETASSATKPDEKMEVEMTDADAEGEFEPAAAPSASSSGEEKKETEKGADTDGDYVLVDAAAEDESTEANTDKKADHQD